MFRHVSKSSSGCTISSLFASHDFVIVTVNTGYFPEQTVWSL